jgi:hypothetical protein
MKAVWAARHCALTAVLATMVAVLTSGGARAQPLPAPAAGQDSSSIEQLFNQTCAACHGAGGTGGDRAPPLVNSPHLRSLPDERIRTIIHEGTAGGMPPFSGLPETELNWLGWWHSFDQTMSRRHDPLRRRTSRPVSAFSSVPARARSVIWWTGAAGSMVRISPH